MSEELRPVVGAQLKDPIVRPRLSEATPSIGLLNFGRCYADAAQALITQIASGQLYLKFNEPILFLLGQSLELEFSAILRAKGITIEKLRSIGKGHDLIKLLDAARKVFNDELAISPEAMQNFRLLNIHFKKPYQVRYLILGYTVWPDVSVLLDLARMLYDRFRPACEEVELASGGALAVTHCVDE